MMDERLGQAYDSCVIDGLISLNQDYVPAQIRNISESAKSGFHFAKKIKEIKDADWNIVYRDYYDILRTLCYAFVSMDNVRISDARCVFAYICSKHPELEFDWDFFEKARIKVKNSLEGRSITRDDWKEAELQMELYINHLIKVLEEKLPKSDDLSV